MSYFEKLKDPRWQKKRSRILERDSFTCRHCDSTTKTLNVHHLAYSKDPWDSQDEDLLTLCEDCHEDCEKALKSLRKALGTSKELALFLHVFAALIDSNRNRQDAVNILTAAIGAIVMSPQVAFETGQKFQIPEK